MVTSLSWVISVLWQRSLIQRCWCNLRSGGSDFRRLTVGCNLPCLLFPPKKIASTFRSLQSPRNRQKRRCTTWSCRARVYHHSPKNIWMVPVWKTFRLASSIFVILALKRLRLTKPNRTSRNSCCSKCLGKMFSLRSGAISMLWFTCPEFKAMSAIDLRFPPFPLIQCSWSGRPRQRLWRSWIAILKPLDCSLTWQARESSTFFRWFMLGCWWEKVRRCDLGSLSMIYVLTRRNGKHTLCPVYVQTHVRKAKSWASRWRMLSTVRQRTQANGKASWRSSKTKFDRQNQTSQPPSFRQPLTRSFYWTQIRPLLQRWWNISQIKWLQSRMSLKKGGKRSMSPLEMKSWANTKDTYVHWCWSTRSVSRCWPISSKQKDAQIVCLRGSLAFRSRWDPISLFSKIAAFAMKQRVASFPISCREMSAQRSGQEPSVARRSAARTDFKTSWDKRTGAPRI